MIFNEKIPSGSHRFALRHSVTTVDVLSGDGEGRMDHDGVVATIEGQFGYLFMRLVRQ